MIWLSNSTLSRLRDQLKSRGARPSVAPPAGVSAEAAQALAIGAEYGPFCEAMYLMMSADGKVSHDEREVLKGALRNLSGDTLRGSQIESLLDEAAGREREQGRDKRLAEVASELSEDPARAEVALVLAAAIAFADSAIADEENDTLSAFAEALGISEDRVNALFDSVEADLDRQRNDSQTA